MAIVLIVVQATFRCCISPPWVYHPTVHTASVLSSHL